MLAIHLLRRPQAFPRTLARFLMWYFLQKPIHIVKTYFAYAFVILEIFSIWFLIKTLFKPWKNVVESYPRSMLDVEKVMQAFFLNLTTRFVGGLVRLCVIIIGLFFQAVALAWFSFYLTLWLTFPFLIPALFIV